MPNRGEVTASITICVEQRAPLFTNPEIVATFVDMLGNATERWSCSVVVYCFMPDHLHFVLQGKLSSADLWRTIIDFKQRSGYWLAQHQLNVSWQKDFHDHIIRKDEDLYAHVRYILDNPCRTGLVANWEDYPFKGSMEYDLEDMLGSLPL